MRLVTPGETAPASVSRFLLPHEHQVITVRQHPAVLLKAVVIVLGGLIVAGVLTSVAASAGSTLVAIIWWAWLLSLVYLVEQVSEWAVNYFIVTNQRMVYTYGLLTRKVAMMPLSKVTDMSFQRSPVGRIFGFGKFILESAGQDQALREINYIPYPEQVYLEVCGMIFPSKDSADD